MKKKWKSYVTKIELFKLNLPIKSTIQTFE